MRLLSVGWVLIILMVATASGQEAMPSDGELKKKISSEMPRITSNAPLLPPLETPPTQYLTLNDCLRLAYENHPQLQDNVQAVVQAEANLRVVDASYLPTLSLDVDRTEETTTSFSTSPSFFTDTTAQVSLTQTIMDTGQRRKQGDAARATLRASVRDFQSTWIDQTQSVASAYISLLEAEYQRSIQVDNLQRTQLNLDVAEAFYRGGVKSMVDVTTARVQVSQAEVSLISAENDLKVALVKLAQVVGVEEETLAGRPLKDLLFERAVMPSREDALAYLREYHPTLTSLTQQAESSFATAAAARRANAPVITGSAYYGNTGLQFPSSPIWQIQLSLSFPFFTPDVGPNSDANEAQARQFLAQREAQELLLIEQLDTALYNIQGARERVRASEDAVREALLNGELAYKRYKFGLSEITELVNAREFIETSRTRLVQALSDLKTAEVSFAQAMGQIPLPPGVPEESPLLQIQFNEMPVREKARKEAIPHRPGVNER